MNMLWGFMALFPDILTDKPHIPTLNDKFYTVGVHVRMWGLSADV